MEVSQEQQGFAQALEIIRIYFPGLAHHCLHSAVPRSSSPAPLDSYVAKSMKVKENECAVVSWPANEYANMLPMTSSGVISFSSLEARTRELMRLPLAFWSY